MLPIKGYVVTYAASALPAAGTVDSSPPEPHPGSGVDAPQTWNARADLPAGRIAYTISGQGPALLLLHGLGATRTTWDQLVATLATRYTVIAPDLPGHGESDPPAGDYSLGAHAAAMRDLLVALGYTSASVVGHSLGGGVALQFAYQFPDRVSRLLLLSSGGLGTELTPALRAATVPGAEWVVSGVSRIPSPLTRSLLTGLALWPKMIAPSDVTPVLDGIRGCVDTGRRKAFLGSARAVISWRGQTVSALRQIGLLSDLPVLFAWGTDDRTIPPSHHRSVAGLLPGATYVAVPGAGHYPHYTHAETLLPQLLNFLTSTEAFTYDEARWRRRLTAAASTSPAPQTATTAARPRNAAVPPSEDATLPRAADSSGSPTDRLEHQGQAALERAPDRTR